MLLRTFIAIEIPNEIKKQIISQTVGLRQKAARSVRWGAPENIHITLKFLGEISPAQVDLLLPMLKSEAAKYAPFEMTVDELGAFPNVRRPRIIWLGLNAPSALMNLQQSLESAVTRLGHLPDQRPYSPHLTIGRVREALSGAEMFSLQHALEAAKVNSPGTFIVKSIHLMQSELKAAGPIYTSLSTAALGG